MELIIKPFHSLPCRLEVFTINGKGADQDDFGYMHDHDAESAETDTCSDMQFEFKFITKEILDKYKITEEEYRVICYELKRVLREGKCNSCYITRILVQKDRMLAMMRIKAI